MFVFKSLCVFFGSLFLCFIIVCLFFVAIPLHMFLVVLPNFNAILSPFVSLCCHFGVF